MTDGQILLWVFAAFCMIVILGMKQTRKKWDRLQTHYPSDIKLPLLDTHNTPTQFDEDKFKQVKMYILPRGLALRHVGLLPMLFIPSKILIPWSAFSPIYTEETKILTIVITNYYSDIKTPEGKIKMLLQPQIAKEILAGKYVQVASK